MAFLKIIYYKNGNKINYCDKNNINIQKKKKLTSTLLLQ